MYPRSNAVSRSDTIVHPEPFPEADGWIIDEVLFGSVGVGKSLDFSKCAPVLRVGSTPKYIRSLVAEAPVADGEVEKHRVLVLPPGRRLTDFAAPRKGDRFLLLFEPRAEGGWSFAVQTVGDIYLLRGERVFRTAWVQHDERSPITWEMIWAPVDETSATGLLERVRARQGARSPG